MTRIQRRQYEMLLRVRDFANTHREAFSGSPVAQEVFESINTAVNDLTATDVVKLSASVGARADRKAMARKALLDVLTRAGQLARVMRAQGQTVPAFELPRSTSDQGYLTTARQFAQDAAGFDAEFTGHGVGPRVIADVAAAFEAAARDRGMKRADGSAASARIEGLLTTALLHVRRLDLIVESVLAADPTQRDVWKEARRVWSTRAARGASVDAVISPPSPEPEAPVEAVPSTTDAPKPAAVIEMPERRAS